MEHEDMYLHEALLEPESDDIPGHMNLGNEISAVDKRPLNSS
jgi:hypothetical protein